MEDIDLETKSFFIRFSYVTINTNLLLFAEYNAKKGGNQMKTEWEQTFTNCIVGLIFILLPLFFIYVYQNSQPSTSPNVNEENKTSTSNESDKDEQKELKTKVIWGIDSASLTTEELYACVNEHFGKPAIWGRYLGTTENVSQGLTKDEVQYLHDLDIKVLPIYNLFTDATGYENGVNEAESAIEIAKELGFPEGVAIFADIEPNYPVNEDFIQGWFDRLTNSDYIPGIYGVFDKERELYTQLEKALNSNKEMKNELLIWSAHPQNEPTPKDKAPNYKPNGPKNSKIIGWQYGINAKSCNIDTNLFQDDMIDYSW